MEYQTADVNGVQVFYSEAGQLDAKRVQIDFFYDYRTNVVLYPVWPDLLRKQQPGNLTFRGKDDIFFARKGGEAYLRDLPQAEMHRLASGHFAVVDHLEYIAEEMIDFHARLADERRSAEVGMGQGA